MFDDDLYERFQDLQAYVGWTHEDAARIKGVADFVRPRMHILIDDFYAEIERHPEAVRVITGGAAQIERLKASLMRWLSESMDGRSDADYVARRWNIGLRHAEIGLNPAYTSAAMSRLRNGLISLIAGIQHESPADFRLLVQSFNRLLDLDLAIIQDAYQAEYLKRELLAEQERSEIKFQMLVEVAACMVVILRPDRTVAYLSPFGEELTGYRLTDIVRQDFVELFVSESAKRNVAAQIEATLEGQPMKAYELPILRSDGSQRWVVWNTQRLDEFDGRPAVLAVGQDVTEQREGQERLVRSERLAGIGQMIAGLAHESRNALQRIQVCGEMLELEVDGNDEALRLLRQSQQAQDQLHRLFEEVRGYAAPIQLERTTCGLDSVWREAWNQLESLRRDRDASLIERTNGIDMMLSVDRFRLVQLFRNLFENALAACKNPVVIELDCREVEFQQGCAIETRIGDNGPGLSPEAYKNVFEPFFTTKTKGTGLGMAIARRIVDAHGGVITVGNSLRRGAEFVVTLPRLYS